MCEPTVEIHLTWDLRHPVENRKFSIYKPWCDLRPGLATVGTISRFDCRGTRSSVRVLASIKPWLSETSGQALRAGTMRTLECARSLKTSLFRAIPLTRPGGHQPVALCHDLSDECRNHTAGAVAGYCAKVGLCPRKFPLGQGEFVPLMGNERGPFAGVDDRVATQANDDSVVQSGRR